MIKLGYIDGYNRLNQPSFISLSEQQNYFDSLVIYTDDAYYPPFFTNIIKLSNDDVPQTSHINFVILVHNDKYYYYFIDDIEYINEDIYNIKITLDTIQTFFFDFNISEARINRKSINRWNDDLINREYIRENLSLEDKEIISSDTNYDSHQWLLIVTDDSSSIKKTNDVPLAVREGLRTYGTNLYYYLFPLPYYSASYDANMRIVLTDGSNTSTEYTLSFIYGLLSDTHTIYARLISNDLLGISITSESYLSPDDDTSGKYTRRISSSVQNYLSFIIQSFNVTSINLRYSNNAFTVSDVFTKNTSTGVEFSSEYIPQLLDENYIDYFYGTPYDFLSVPLNKLTNQDIEFFSYYNMVSDEVVSYYNDTTDAYGHRNVSKRNADLELTTDLWKQYANLYSSTITEGKDWQHVKTSVNAGVEIYSGLVGMLGGIIGMGAASTPVGSGGAISGAMGGALGVFKGTTNMIMDNIDIEKQYEINKANLENAPNNIRNSADFLTNYINNSNRIRLIKYKVRDYEEVAKRMEYYGYKVNEIFRGNAYLYNLSNIRYYYNVIALDLISYTTYSLIPTNFMNDIINRLSSGIRLFNISSISSSSMISALRYDNVEYEDIEITNVETEE